MRPTPSKTPSGILALALHHYLLTRNFLQKQTENLNDAIWTHDKSSLEFTFKVVSLSPTQVLFAAAATQDAGKSTSLTLNPQSFLCQKFDFDSSAETSLIDAIESPGMQPEH
jgi:hypothetical protein